MGLNQQLTLLAAERLPPEISFSFNPYAQDLKPMVERARTIGHEALLDLPMEPFDYPSSDPGPYTLLTSLNEDENIRRLDWALSRASGFIGFANLMGSKYTSSPDHMGFVAERLKARGQIGRAHVCTPVTNAHLVCRLLLEKKKKTNN